MKNRYTYILTFILAIFFVGYPKSACRATEIKDKLTTAFARAFSKAEYFKESRVFDLLNYNKNEINLIGNITPRPATISVSLKGYSANGHFETIRVQCQNIKYYNMVIDNAVFEFPDSILDMNALDNGKIIFKYASMVKLETNVSESDLLKVFALVAKAKSLTRLKLKLNKNRVMMRGRAKRGWLVVQFHLVGSVSLVNSTRMNFRCNKLTLNRFPLPRGAINTIFRRINPVFDSDKTWLNLKLDKVKISKGFVRTHARIMPKVHKKGLHNANR